MYASTWPLLWWMYNDDTVWSMFSFLQNSLNSFETKLVPVTDIILHGNPYSANMILQYLMSYCADSPAFLMIGKFLWWSTVQKQHPLSRVNMSVPTASHSMPGILWGIILSFVVFARTPCMLSIFLWLPWCSHLWH